MGEPFMLVSAIAGVISLAVEITEVTHAYVRDVGNYTKEVKEFDEALAGLSDVLRQLERLLKTQHTGSLVFEETSVLFSTHRECRTKLEETRKKLRRRFQDHKTVRIVKQLTWPLTSKEHRQVIANIYRWMHVFHYALTIDGCALLAKTADEVSSVLGSQLKTLEETKNISKSLPVLLRSTEDALTSTKALIKSVSALGKVETTVTDIALGVQKLLDREESKVLEVQDRKRCELLQWLSSLDFRPKQNDNLNRRSPKTGNWLLEDEKFQVWLNREQPSGLWCPGIPGAGKTVLASTVVHHLQSNLAASSTTVAYVYFDYKDKERQTVPAILSNLLRQYLDQLQTMPEGVQRLYNSRPTDQKECRLESPQCISLMREWTTGGRKVFMVFDALDECPELDDESQEVRAKMINAISTISSFASVFVTSRPHVDLSLALKDCLQVEIFAHGSDILSYVQNRAANHVRLRNILNIDSGLEQYIGNTIRAKAHGMFLLARIQMDSVITQTSSRSIRRTLGYLPEKLNQTFDDALQRIRSQPKEYTVLAERVISWVFYAKRPLRIAELREAVSVEPGDSFLDRSGFHETELLVSVCCGLIAIDREDDAIRLVHYSFQEFLATCWSTQRPDAERAIAVTCLTYLNFEDVAIRGELQDITSANVHESLKHLQKYDLVGYVCCYWADHVKGRLEKQLEVSILDLFQKKGQLLKILYLYYNVTFCTRIISETNSSIHIAAIWGFVHKLKDLVDLGVDIDLETIRDTHRSCWQ